MSINWPDRVDSTPGVDINTELDKVNAEIINGFKTEINTQSAKLDTVDTYGANEVPVLILLGQSNMDGRGNTADLPDLDVTFAGEVKIYDKPITRNPANSTINRVNNGVWKDYALGDMVTSPTGTASTAFGPELSIAIQWRDTKYNTTGKPLYIIKCAVGGTGLAADANPDNSWDTSDDSLRQLFYEYFAAPALLDLRLQGLTPKCVGIIWGQGETDSFNSTKAAAYEANLTQLVGELPTTIGFPDAQFYLMGLSEYLDGDADWDLVKTAQANVATANSNVTLIPTDGSGTEFKINRYISGDPAGEIHYNSSGTMTLGVLYFKNLDLINRIDYVTPYLYEFFSNAASPGTPMPKDAITVDDHYGNVSPVMFPTSGSAINAMTWVRSGSDPARTNIADNPTPNIFITNANPHTDIEVVFQLLHDGDVDTKPGVFVRGSGFSTVDNKNVGYLAQVRQGGAELTFFEGDGVGYSAFPSSPITPTQSPAAGDPYWYKVTMIANNFRMYNSPDGKIWTLQFDQNDPTYTTGELVLSLFNGRMDKAIGGELTAHCAFSNILIKQL